MESNPKDEFVLLSAGHDGQLFLWDIESGVSVAHFINNIDGQGHGSVFDAKWSPDGTMIAATDSHGHMLIFGLGIGPDKYKLVSKLLKIISLIWKRFYNYCFLFISFSCQLNCSFILIIDLYYVMLHIML